MNEPTETEAPFGSPDCTCIPYTRKYGTPRYCGPNETVDDISGWEQGTDCPHHAPAAPLPPADQTALRDRTAAALYAHDHPSHTVPLNETGMEAAYRETADAVLAVLPATPGRAALVRACASFVRDTYSGEWADDAAATLETDADRIERGEPCSLLRLAAALPATTNHDTDTSAGPVDRAEYDALVAEADRLRRDGAALHAQAVAVDEQLAVLRQQVAAPVDRAAVLREAADQYAKLTDQNEAYDREHGELDEEARLRHEVVRDVVAGLRRMADECPECGTTGACNGGPCPLRRVADETAATETQAAAPGRRQTVEYFVQSQQPDGTWESASSFSTDLDFAAARLAARREKMPDLTLRLAERTTTIAVRALPGCLACRHWSCDGTGECGALLDAWQRCTCVGSAAEARQDGAES